MEKARKSSNGNGDNGMHEVQVAFYGTAKNEERIKDLLVKVDVHLACLSAANVVGLSVWAEASKARLAELRAELIRLEYYSYEAQ